MLKPSEKFFSTLFFIISFWGCLICSATTNIVYAQDTSPDSYYSLWGGYSFNSVKFLGKTGNSQTSIFAVGYRHQIKSFRGEGKLYYTADLIPYLHFEYPKRDENDRRVERNGFGISPVGFLWKEDELHMVVPFAQISGGLIYMESEFPTDLSRRLNFTFDVTLGTNLKIGSAVVLSLGYKFHHISNAETGKHNPGLDSNFLFLSISTQ